MNGFIFDIVRDNPDRIKLVIETRGDITRKKNLFARAEYFLTLLLILGFSRTLGNVFKFLKCKIRKDRSVRDYCDRHNIKYLEVESVNSPQCIVAVKDNKIDLLFNQSQHILKKEILSVPRIGVMNRHGALLPEYRGRLAPFWQLLNREKVGGLTYHLMDEKIDNGPIVYQKKITIEPGETVGSLIDKMFSEAKLAFKNAVDILDCDNWREKLIPNDEAKATYFSSPRLKNAIKYRFGR